MKKLLALFLALITLLSLSACKGDDGETPPADQPPALDTSLEINVWTLNGTTGFGMAPLIANKAAGTAALNYKFTIETKPQNVRAALVSGDADIAAVPTALASTLYNATNGGVKLLAINTGGVLYLVCNSTRGAAATTLADLAGKTVYCPAGNPQQIVEALLTKAGIKDQVTLDSTTYAEPENLRNAVATGAAGVDYAVLPEPMVTIAKSAASNNSTPYTLNVAIDLTTEWNQHFTAGSLVQGCVVVRTKFLEEHPLEVAKFLEEYGISVNYVKDNPNEAATKIKDAGIFANENVAKVAIPKCNLCFLTGNDMKTAMSTFLAAMPTAAIGGKLPADDFYYGVQ